MVLLEVPETLSQHQSGPVRAEGENERALTIGIPFFLLGLGWRVPSLAEVQVCGLKLKSKVSDDNPRTRTLGSALWLPCRWTPSLSLGIFPVEGTLGASGPLTVVSSLPITNYRYQV